ncbi:DUF4350 domain-containing protein [Streptomyces spectabilis]|uniref:DUF4350 domain-containing protein n=1 Tax=Streptomyces spectabilis TaxID=68270 RepID=A0A5P2X7B9_STRST|nr:DUF4350 domain-containing protein [Streptomyces spectabilis]MBB5106509.1 hypothetical protein [Streptomyces spectabilis]MCI3903118.1 DUF4350 domain-containing protein [Streptomyces spectabilis]QEV60358.1 DUF4350 domain-containing protein [Streptomyces spectabilis]GGV54407.1 hypothetical protein GCM10010245_85960 [Streptomyces spectabilis]
MTGPTSPTSPADPTNTPGAPEDTPPQTAAAPTEPPDHTSPPAGTSLSPTPRQLWTRTRGIALAFVVLLAAGIAIAAVRSGAQHGRLDPRSADPYGSRAVAELLDDRGVSTRVVTTTEEARSAVGPDTTLLVADPDVLTERQQSRLHAATERSGGRTLLVAPNTLSVSTLAPGVTADSARSLDSTLSPGCSLPAARRAGTADVGGIRYETIAPGADACYSSDGLPSLLRLPTTAASGDTKGDTVVLGAPDILYNDRLDEHGNASLALQLLGSRPHLVWYLPSLADDAVDDSADEDFFDLIPSGWLWGTLQLAVAAVLAALWRARRLGPLVPEKLPVAIRASEAVEGRARLYRKADARDRAATALRSATRTRLAPLVGVPTARAHSPEALLPALASRLRAPGRDPHPLLFGPPPGDDAGLIALADQLDALESEVRSS